MSRAIATSRLEFGADGREQLPTHRIVGEERIVLLPVDDLGGKNRRILVEQVGDADADIDRIGHVTGRRQIEIAVTGNSGIRRVITALLRAGQYRIARVIVERGRADEAPQGRKAGAPWRV